MQLGGTKELDTCIWSIEIILWQITGNMREQILNILLAILTTLVPSLGEGRQ